MREIPGTLPLLGILAATALLYVVRWYLLERSREADLSQRRPGWLDSLVGFVTNFFDTLGIGSFALTTAIYKFRHQPPDEKIPGTLNVGHALATITQALIFINAVTVDITTLVSMILAAVLGAFVGAGVAARLPRRIIQLSIGFALLISAMLIVVRNIGWMPGGGDAIGLEGSKLALAIGVNFVLGVLMMVGVGLYAPCLILVSVLGMNPLAAFPIMMGACAFLMPIGGVRFIRANHYSLRSALGLTIGGIPGVLVAAFVVRSLPMVWLRWLVAIVVIYTSLLMFYSMRKPAHTGNPIG